ncbi:ATP-binding SpoIIE family protein phosphatase [Nonomuraea polychroma]|uniref:ATP-binding SpoIIE family protein phosphatase n=1 Tax=Nonomuraea polychroma TaxID=46176 RepID=UPI003D8A3F75
MHSIFSGHEPLTPHTASEERPISDRIREFTAALGNALTVQDVVQAVANHVLPPFGATGLNIFLLQSDHLRAVGGAGYSREFTEAVEHMPVSNHIPSADVIRARVPMFVTSAAEFVHLYPHLADMPVRGGKSAWVFLPLIASGHTMGSCVISFDWPRLFTAEERNLFTTVSGLVAQALERARLFDLERVRAEQLQRMLLPRALPSMAAVSTAARYLPARKDMEVGGDWYDVIRLSSERVALVVGDVMGHGVSQAALMGRLSTAVDALASLELPPGELLTHLNDLVSRFGDEFYATCLYMTYDPTTRECLYASAGHPPPAVVHPTGAVTFPDNDPNPPLGAATPPFNTGEMTLPEGSLLVLYTDGLVESATLDIDQGMTALVRALTAALAKEPDAPAAHSGGPGEEADDRGEQGRLESLCDALTTTLPPVQQRPANDTVLLVARTHALPARDVASWPLSVEAKAAGQARKFVRAQLASWGLKDLTPTTELLVSELVGNTVRHSKGPIRLRLLRGDVLTCEVSDGSITIPRVRHAAETDEGGRGLHLVAALSQRWGTRYTATGQSIWAEQSLHCS